MVVIAEESGSNITALRDLSGTLRARDATLFVVGVGRGMDDPNVKAVASKEEYAYHVTWFNEIMSVAPKLSDQICSLEGMF